MQLGLPVSDVYTQGMCISCYNKGQTQLSQSDPKQHLPGL